MEDKRGPIDHEQLLKRIAQEGEILKQKKIISEDGDECLGTLVKTNASN